MNAHTRVTPDVVLGDILAKQRAAFIRDGAPTLAQRMQDLHKLKRAVRANKDAIVKALNTDFGNRCGQETAVMEVTPLIQGINAMRRSLAKWMRPEKRRVGYHFMLSKAYVVRQPLGVVGVISPWNYPVSLALMPLATAIAAGNRCMIKLSEFTPAINAVLKEMLDELFPAEQVAVVIGGADVGASFSGLRFDHLMFTGSATVGRAVMKAASANLVPVTLELGGKSPVIVEPGYAIERAAKSVAYGKLSNAGQVCVAPDYLLLRSDLIEQFVGAYDMEVRALYPNGPLDDNYTSILNDRHYDRLKALLEDAQQKGARIVEVGRDPGFARKKVHTMAPTIVLDVTDDMAIMQQEIFGPILPIVASRNVQDSIAYVNARPRPLALYYFGDDPAGRRDVLTQTTSGNVSINETLMHFVQDALPFGGVGESGMGAYHGVEGFLTLSHTKGVFEQGPLNFIGLLKPPFGRVFEFVTKVLQL